MNASFFSICIPVYNAEPFIAETLASVFDQTFSDWELIIRNDGSTDGGWEIVKRMTAGRPNVRLFENPRNLGQRETLNLLLPEARGTWVGFLHADDRYRAHTLQTVRDYVKDRDDLMLWAHTRLAVGKGKIPDVILIKKYVTEWSCPDLAEELYVCGNFFGGMSNYLFRRSATTGLLFLGGDYCIDTFYWIRLLKGRPLGKAVYHPDVLTVVNEHPQSLSVSNGLSGEWLVMIFKFSCDALYLGWSRRGRLRRIARMVKAWLRFFRLLGPGDRLLPLTSIATMVKSLFIPPPSTGPGPSAGRRERP